MSDVYKTDVIEIRLGRWQDVLADVEQVDAVITDPPYSERTHSGQYASALCIDGGERRALTYCSWSDIERLEFARHWTDKARGWICICTDHAAFDDYSAPLRCSGRYVFHPIPLVIRAMTVRLGGDGPSSWCVWLNVSRPAKLSKWGALPGAYIGNREAGACIGGKPLWLMRSLVRDYSRPGDLIVDPCAGWGTTLLAAAIEGRHAIGAECDPETFTKAVERLKRGYTPAMRFGKARRAKQLALVDG